MPRSTGELLSSALTLHIHLTIKLRPQAGYNLHLAPTGNPILFNKGDESLNLFHPFLILAKQSSTSPLVPAKDSLLKTYLKMNEQPTPYALRV